MRASRKAPADLTGVDDAIAQVYELLDAELDRIGHHDADAALARVAQRETEAGTKPIERRGFLSYLRWCMAHPYAILMDDEKKGLCPCHGSGWVDVPAGGVAECPTHRPPRANQRHQLEPRARKVAARGREQDERRGL